MLGSLLLAFDPALAAPSSSVVGAISSRGGVQVNGVTAPNGTIVYAGNRIVTAPGAVAIVMLARGGKVALGGSTSASLTVGSGKLLVKLDSGVVDAVSEAKTPVLVEADGITVRARNRSGAFEVAVTGRSLRVFARRGPVVAEGANRTVRIGAGKTMKTSVAHAAKGAGSRMGTVLIVAGAAGAAGLAAAIHGSSGSSKTCVSPSQLSCP
jgi:ferric-dicitrate binding protein FerR (iron transport regulator)